MQGRLKITIAHVLAFILGILPAFFLILAAIFSDGGSIPEYLMVYALVFITYTMLSSIFSYFIPNHHIYVTLSSSAFIIVALYTLTEIPRTLGMIFLYITLPLTALSSSYLGDYIGRKIKKK